MLEVLELALAGGVRMVQLREKDLAVRDLLPLAQAVRNLTARAHAKLFINGRMDICLAVDADGVHLRSDRIPADTVRKILGPDRWIGVSAHSLDEARRAQEEGADYITLGPIYETPSKAPYGPPIGVHTLQEVRRQIKIPIFAIGGIHSHRVSEVMRSGADGIALISAIMKSENPKQAASELIQGIYQRSDSH